MVDILVLGTSAERRAGSSPAEGNVLLPTFSYSVMRIRSQTILLPKFSYKYILHVPYGEPQRVRFFISFSQKKPPSLPAKQPKGDTYR